MAEMSPSGTALLIHSAEPGTQCTKEALGRTIWHFLFVFSAYVHTGILPRLAVFLDPVKET